MYKPNILNTQISKIRQYIQDPGRQATKQALAYPYNV